MVPGVVRLTASGKLRSPCASGCLDTKTPRPLRPAWFYATSATASENRADRTRANALMRLTRSFVFAFTRVFALTRREEPDGRETRAHAFRRSNNRQFEDRAQSASSGAG